MQQIEKNINYVDSTSKQSILQFPRETVSTIDFKSSKTLIASECICMWTYINATAVYKAMVGKKIYEMRLTFSTINVAIAFEWR